MSPPLLPQDITMTSETDVERDMTGETVCGFRVAAWRETHPEHGDKFGHSYSEHWSTPSQNPAVKVERLFTETQLLAALSRAPEDSELGSSTRMTSPASRSQTTLSAGCTCHSNFTSQGSPLEGPCEYCSTPADLDPKSWEVSIRLEGQDILTIGHSHLAGLSDIERYGDVVRNCATHLMSFIGDGEPGPCFLCGPDCSCLPAENGLSGAQRSELTRLAQDEPVSSPPSTGGEGEDWDRIPRAKRFGRRLNESAVKHLAPGTLLRFYSEDPWFDPSPSSPANGDIVVFTGEVSNTFPKVGPHLEVRTLGGRVYPGGGWVYQIFQFVADPSPEMGEISREEIAKIVDPIAFKQWQSLHDHCVAAGDDAEEARATADWAHKATCDVALEKADQILKFKENGLSREELGGSARAGSGAAGPSDCAEGDARLSDGGANPSGGSGA